jgi:hypothetical protein
LLRNLLRGGEIKTSREGSRQKQAQREKEKGSGDAHGFSAHRWMFPATYSAQSRLNIV